MKLFLPICIASFGFMACLQAQQPSGEDSKLPEGPLINKLPADSRCVITVKNISSQSSGDAGAKSLMQRVTMVRSGNLGLDESTDLANNRKTETWTVGGFKVLFDSGSEFPIVTKLGERSGPDLTGAAGNDPTAPPAPSQYPGMECVAKKNFKGVSMVSGRRCLTFTDAEAEASAYVDFDSRFPIAARVVDRGYSYQFSAAPAGSVVVPSKILTAIAEAKERIESASARSSP